VPSSASEQGKLRPPLPLLQGTAASDVRPTSSPATAQAPVDVEAVLTKLADESDEELDWRKSIVDLMKLLKLDSGLKARKQLARELGYTGALKGSAEMNIWLHRQVMRKLADNGGKVPDSLLRKA
jgi:hypothetical protein